MSTQEIPNTCEITMFLHCGLCLAELKELWKKGEEVSPRDYARTQTGYTVLGLQIWCNRHDCNVAHIDFQGKSPFPANCTRIAADEGPQGKQAEA